MKKFLENLIREFNPRHDYDNVRFQNMFTDSLRQNFRAMKANFFPYLKIIKHLGRGVLIGGGIGSLVGKLSGNHIREGFVLGAVLGAYVDLHQYLIKVLVRYFKQYPL